MSDHLEDIDPSDPIHKRNFLLMLSPADGQSISEQAGFSRPSSEVQEAETFDVVTNWITLAASGAMVEIGNTADWITEYVSTKYELKGEELSDIRTAYYTYAVALISYLLQVGVIDLYSHGDIATNMEKFIEYFPSDVVILKEEEDE